MEHLVKVASLPPALIVAITIISVLALNLFAVKLTAFATDCHRKMLVWMLIFGTWLEFIPSTELLSLTIIFRL